MLCCRIAALFLAVNSLVRIGLFGFDEDWAVLLLWRLPAVLGVGALYDLAALAWVLPPFAAGARLQLQPVGAVGCMRRWRAPPWHS